MLPQQCSVHSSAEAPFRQLTHQLVGVLTGLKYHQLFSELLLLLSAGGAPHGSLRGPTEFIGCPNVPVRVLVASRGASHPGVKFPSLLLCAHTHAPPSLPLDPQCATESCAYRLATGTGQCLGQGNLMRVIHARAPPPPRCPPCFVTCADLWGSAGALRRRRAPL
jgi:hypothetical protein